MFLLVPAYPGSPGQKAVKRLCVCVCVCLSVCLSVFVARRAVQYMLKCSAILYSNVQCIIIMYHVYKDCKVCKHVDIMCIM